MGEQLIIAAILVLSGWTNSTGKISCDICQRELQLEYYKPFTNFAEGEENHENTSEQQGVVNAEGFCKK
jgi:hypothetical protein